jgi:hypothetical protein
MRNRVPTPHRGTACRPLPLRPWLLALLTLVTGGCTEGDTGIVVGPERPCDPVEMAFPGTATGSLDEETQCRVGDLPAAFHRFSNPNQGSVRFSFDGQFQAELSVLAHPDFEHVVLRDGPPSLSGAWLLPEATYQLRVVALDGEGAYAISGSTEAERGCVTRRLLPLGSFSYPRDLTRDTCRFPGTDAFFDPYLVLSPRACTILMRSSFVDSYLRVVDARTGDLVAEDEDSGGGATGRDALIELDRCATDGTGPLRVEAGSRVTDDTGRYTLTLRVEGGPPVP